MVANELSDFTAALREDALLDALLVVSELVTNAVRHGAGRIDLRIMIDGRVLRIEVDDECLTFNDASPDSRGLKLIAAMTQSFGVRPTAHGKTVWAVLAV